MIVIHKAISAWTQKIISDSSRPQSVLNFRYKSTKDEFLQFWQISHEIVNLSRRHQARETNPWLYFSI